MKEKDDQDFELQLGQKRHKETVSLIKGLGEIMSTPKKDDGVLKAALDGHLVAMKEIVGEIKSIKFPEYPEQKEPKVNVTVNNDKLEGALIRNEEKLDRVIELLTLSLQPREIKFTVVRGGYNNLIESVTAKETVIKPKYQA